MRASSTTLALSLAQAHSHGHTHPSIHTCTRTYSGANQNPIPIGQCSVAEDPDEGEEGLSADDYTIDFKAALRGQVTTIKELVLDVYVGEEPRTGMWPKHTVVKLDHGKQVTTQSAKCEPAIDTGTRSAKEKKEGPSRSIRNWHTRLSVPSV